MALAPGTELIRPIGAILWDLRRAWAAGKRVSLSLANGERVEGQVQAVSATGATCRVAGVRVLSTDILAVHHPAIGADSSWRGGRWRFDSPRIIPQLEELPGIAEWERRFGMVAA